MASELEVVQNAYAAFQRGDISAVLEKMSPDVSWILAGDPERIPGAGAHRGVPEVAAFFETLDAHQEAQQFEPREFILQGSTVVALGSYRWKIRKNGRVYGSDFAHVFTLKDGKVTSFREYYDTAAAQQAHAD